MAGRICKALPFLYPVPLLPPAAAAAAHGAAASAAAVVGARPITADGSVGAHTAAFIAAGSVGFHVAAAGATGGGSVYPVGIF